MSLAEIPHNRIMVGRNRKGRRRKPCGRLEPEKRPDDRLRIAAQPHRRELAEILRADERAESSLGRCFLRKEITLAEYDAGSRFQVIVGEYRAVIEAPRSLAGTGKGFYCWPGLCAAYQDGCTCRARRERYCRAYEALAEAGRAAILEILHVAIEGEEPANLASLRRGLSSLSRHFGYDSHVLRSS